ncbi:MAG: (d)CMP kinase [Lachnospiraceae bacterium]|nr:(d)CMP kinase [Lachnospiraceae bacterium]
MMSFQVAIDGPAGAGKSTVAKAVAKELEFVYVDTGAMYRAIGLNCIKNGVDIHDEEAVLSILNDTDVSIKYIDNEQAVILNGENVNGQIRTQEVGEAASVVSAYKLVREKMVALQQSLAVTEDVVMDGRDIASCVLPNAQVKIYLDASVEVRAKRRYLELIEKGKDADLKTVEDEVRERDYRDMHRENSPLIRVPEAILVDSSYMTIDEVVAEIVNKVKNYENE